MMVTQLKFAGPGGTHMLAISGIYVVIIALLAMILGAMVSIHRAKANISILHGDDMQLAEKMRRHGNLAETAPFALLLLIVAILRQ